jgi:hemerythrin-like domain-containing protein
MARRHESLIPLSHQHHHGLFVSLRLEQKLPEARRDSAAMAALARAILTFFDRDLVPHFAAEEQTLFPVMEQYVGKLALIEELLEEHRQLRALVDRLRQSDPEAQAETLQTFGELLRDHIRKEERQLFPIFEEKLPEAAARTVGEHIKPQLPPPVVPEL